MPIDPQYGIELTADQISTQMPMSVNYGVTPNNKFIPVKVDTLGRFELGAGVTLDASGLELGDVGITGVDPADSDSKHEIAVLNLGSGNGYSIRSSIFDGVNRLKVNADGSIDTNITVGSSIPVIVDHNTDSIAIYGTDGTTDTFIKTDASGNLQVGIVGTPTITVGNSSLAVTQSGAWSTGRTWALASGTDSVSAVQSGNWPVRLQDGSGNAITSTSSALDVNIKSDLPGATSSAVTSVLRSNVNQTFLAANTSRKGSTLYNDSGALLYVKLGATASSSDFTVRLGSQDYYEVPFKYAGRIDGIWATAGVGSVLITELT